MLHFRSCHVVGFMVWCGVDKRGGSLRFVAVRCGAVLGSSEKMVGITT